MKPTEKLRKKLRRFLNDVLPEGGDDKNAAFSDDELDEMLEDSTSVYYAASEGWYMKAGMIEEGIESYSAGNEKYDLTSMKDRLSYYLSMAERYKAKGDSESSLATSLLLKVKPPEVL